MYKDELIKGKINTIQLMKGLMKGWMNIAIRMYWKLG